MMIERRWLEQQIAHTVSQWDQTLNQRYPETRAWSESADAYVKHLTETCNYLNAAKQIDFSSYLPPESMVLDLGCGGGWLTAYLSTLPNVARLYALDSSRRYLEAFLPSVIRIMNGIPGKVVSVEGLFSPLMLEDASLDGVVASSVLHHADNLESMLCEIRRVLKKGSFLIILNETPTTASRHILQVSKAFTRIFLALLTKTYNPNPQSISSGAYIEEPYLGDRCFPPWYWMQAIQRSEFELHRIVDSGLATVAKGEGPRLTHFVCKAA